jgi:hypothetical protein
METDKLTVNFRLNLDIAISYLTDLLQSHNFGVNSMILLKAHTQADRNCNQYSLIRVLYPKENLLDQYLAASTCKLVRCSILIQELSISQVKVELSRPCRSLNCSLNCKDKQNNALVLADEKLDEISQELKELELEQFPLNKVAMD